jgi:hypothetical protein
MECTVMRTLSVAIVVAMYAAAFAPPALPAGLISYQLETPNGGPPTPGPTDPNAPLS